jgi:hypothetical protein
MLATDKPEVHSIYAGEWSDELVIGSVVFMDNKRGGH